MPPIAMYKGEKILSARFIQHLIFIPGKIKCETVQLFRNVLIIGAVNLILNFKWAIADLESVF